MDVGKIRVPGFEIFKDLLDVHAVEGMLLEEIRGMKTEELIDPTDVAVMSELDEFIESSLVDLFYENDEIDVIMSNLFEDDSVFLSKVNDINTDFAYLCDVLPDGTVHCIDHSISIFDINSVQTHSINIGTKEQPKEITLAFDITADESEKFEKILNKRKRCICMDLRRYAGNRQDDCRTSYPHGSS